MPSGERRYCIDRRPSPESVLPVSRTTQRCAQELTPHTERSRELSGVRVAGHGQLGQVADPDPADD